MGYNLWPIHKQSFYKHLNIISFRNQTQCNSDFGRLINQEGIDGSLLTIFHDIAPVQDHRSNAKPNFLRGAIQGASHYTETQSEQRGMKIKKKRVGVNQSIPFFWIISPKRRSYWVLPMRPSWCLPGCVRVNGQDVRKVSQKSLRAAIGMVPQEIWTACQFFGWAPVGEGEKKASSFGVCTKSF